MWWDRDIDARMPRTQKRPTSRGEVSGGEALRLGLALSVLGVGWAVWMGALYGVVVFAGLFFDVVVYSMWLKRRTCWSIVWGGISGAMPILAGRVLAVGQVDMVGLLLAGAVLFWIPTHTLTFSMKFARDYAAAGVPTFPSTGKF
jgi:protoheme IX farnesyltransferase